MLLLRFTVTNHGSFRDQSELTLVQSRLHTNSPREGETWADFVGSVAAIYGANGAGKSQFLDALRYFKFAVRNSATRWTERDTIPRSHFRLDRTSRDEPSEYILDFVKDEIRYEYGFSVSSKAVVEEWLHSYPTGRKRVLFDRNGNDLNFGRALKGGEARIREALGERELVLSKGALLRYPQLSEIAELISSQIDVAEFGEEHRRSRLSALMADVLDSKFDIDDLRTMLKVADVGITGADVASKEIPPQAEKILRAIYEASENTKPLEEDMIKQVLAETGRSLFFEHLGDGGETYKLSSQRQSDGTLTWLSLAAPAIAAIRTGSIFVVDELDSSLHPQLAQVMIQLFKDPKTNPRGAQLIFTTHDTYFLSKRSRVALSPDEVYFVEKDRSGASSIFSLADFPIRKDQDYAARYLEGRYGAVPTVAPSFLAVIVERHRDADPAELLG